MMMSSVIAANRRSGIAIQNRRTRAEGARTVADINPTRLRGQLAENYDGLVKKLTRRLGTSDFAHEALHDTFLRLDRVPDTVLVLSPTDYIFRTAINIAKDRRKAQTYRAGATEIDALPDVSDDRPDPARVVEARSEIAAFKRALAELPERPREVFHSISIEGNSAHDVAARLKISLRTVESDFKLALRHCADRLDHILSRRLGGPRLRV